MKPTILLHSGRYYDYLDPEGSTYDIEDVAHALSQQNRFAGHTVRPYPTAAHCCMVHDHLPAQHQKAGLLHDGHESFVIDAPSPMKLVLPGYKAFEVLHQEAFLARFGLRMADVLDPAVKQADLEALATEKRDLFPYDSDPGQWTWLEARPWALPTPDWSPARAKREFLDRYEQLSTL